MDIKNKMNENFRALEGGLFSTVTKADVGEGAGNLMAQGVDIMAWADPIFPDPSIPESVKKVMIDAIEEGSPSHYTMPIGALELREALAKKVSRKTGACHQSETQHHHHTGLRFRPPLLHDALHHTG